MVRSFFLAIGTYLILAGLQCFLIDRIYWKAQVDPAPPTFFFQKAESKPREFPPAPWVAWCLFTTGTVVCLYSFTIPKRMGGAK